MTTTEPIEAVATDEQLRDAGYLPTVEDSFIAALSDEPQRLEDESHDDYEQRLDAWREGFLAETLEDADYCARALRRVQARESEIRQLAETEIARIRAWVDRQTDIDPDTGTPSRIAKDRAYWNGRLEAFHRARREADPKHAKVIELPCGMTLRSQAGRPTVRIDDPAVAAAWLAEHCAVAITYPDPLIVKAEIVRHFGGKIAADKSEGEFPAVNSDGEVLPGVTMVRPPATFTRS